MAMSKTRKTVLIISGILLGVILIGALAVALVVSAFRGKSPSIQDNSVLAVKISGSLPDYVPDDPFRRLLGGQPQDLKTVLTNLRKAKVDRRITAVMLDIDMSEAGWAKSEEIRAAIEDFRTSGKPVYAYMETGLNKDYYIATACDKIFLPPPGELFTIGLAADVMFFRGSLDKLGIYPDVYQIGKYKSAGDTFTQKQMTDAHRQYINELLDDLNSRYLDAIARARSKSVEDVKNLIDNAPYSAAAAKQAGMIDGVMYHDEVEKELKKRLGYKDGDQLHIARGGDYKDISQESLGLNKGEKIAVVYASGDITSGSSTYSSSGQQTIGSDSLVKTLNDAAKDSSIKAIVLRVDSPGGSGLASDIIWRAIETAKEKKPVVVSMGDVAASGGYYIACNANRIVAEPSTITGSIGVVGGKPVLKGFYDWIVVTNEYVLRGKNSGMFRESEKFSDTERAKFEEFLNNTYQDFIGKVATGRAKDKAYIDSIGQGRVWTGQQGKEKGLVDEFGGIDKAVEIAKQLAKIPAEKGVQRVPMPTPPTFLQQLLGLNNDDDDAQTSEQAKQQASVLAALPEDARETLRYAQMLDRVRHGEAIYMLPFRLRIK